jgi:hypothetical protein
MAQIYWLALDPNVRCPNFFWLRMGQLAWLVIASTHPTDHQLFSGNGNQTWLVGKFPRLLRLTFSMRPTNFYMDSPSQMLHGAGICIPTFTQTKSPSHVGLYIPAPWFAYGHHLQRGHSNCTPCTPCGVAMPETTGVPAGPLPRCGTLPWVAPVACVGCGRRRRHGGPWAPSPKGRRKSRRSRLSGWAGWAMIWFKAIVGVADPKDMIQYDTIIYLDGSFLAS